MRLRKLLLVTFVSIVSIQLVGSCTDTNTTGPQTHLRARRLDSVTGGSGYDQPCTMDPNCHGRTVPSS